MEDREFLEKRLELFSSEAYDLFTEELTSMAESHEKIQTQDDEKNLDLR